MLPKLQNVKLFLCLSLLWQCLEDSKCWYTIVLQNFDSIPHVQPGQESFYGGSVSLADYCPYIQEFTWRSKNVIVRGSHCQYFENNPSM